MIRFLLRKLLVQLPETVIKKHFTLAVIRSALFHFQLIYIIGFWCTELLTKGISHMSCMLFDVRVFMPMDTWGRDRTRPGEKKKRSVYGVEKGSSTIKHGTCKKYLITLLCALHAHECFRKVNVVTIRFIWTYFFSFQST